MFRFFRWLFRKQFNDYVFDHTLKNAEIKFDEKQENYIKMLSKDAVFNSILDVFITSIVSTGMASNDVNGIMKRNEWINCMGFVKKMINTRKPKPEPKLNPLTNEPFRAIKK